MSETEIIRTLAEREYEWSEHPICPSCGYIFDALEWHDENGERECDCGVTVAWSRSTLIRYSTAIIQKQPPRTLAEAVAKSLKG